MRLTTAIIILIGSIICLAVELIIIDCEQKGLIMA
jgi:hypothetical protein